MNHYQLSRHFWDYSFEHTGKLKPNHIALYFFAIEHCNRLGWKKNFGLPTAMVLDAINVKSYSVYKKTFDELVEMGFFEVVEYSKNQYSSNIIALKENSKANSKALDNALSKHASKHTESTIQSTVSINKPLTYNKEPYNEEQENQFKIEDCLQISLRDERWVKANKTNEKELIAFNEVLEKRGVYEKLPADYKTHFANWKDGGKLEIAAPETKGHTVKFSP